MPTRFDQWKKDLRRLLAFYGVSGGQVLSELELNYLWRHGVSLYRAYDISTDVANGFTFEESAAATFRGRNVR